MRIEGSVLSEPSRSLATLLPLSGDPQPVSFSQDGLGFDLPELELPYGQDEADDPRPPALSPLGRLQNWWSNTVSPLFQGDAPFSAGGKMSVVSVGNGFHLIGALPRNQRKDLGKNQQVLAAFEAMKQAAEKEGITLDLVSYYRSYAQQKKLWERSDKTGRWVARPGSSEHHTGLALDVGTPGYGKASRKGKFEASPAYRWLRENGYRFGFVQSMSWESWHWRYDPQGIRESLAAYDKPRIPEPPAEKSLWQSAKGWLKGYFDG